MEDMLWHNPTTGGNTIWLRNGDSRQSRVALPATTSGWSPFGVFDMDDDNMADILWRNDADGANRLWLMDGIQRRESLPVTAVPDQSWIPVAVGNVSN
jgi:hypothetical protein|tara:strand:- start:5666 stop:5959 length:294 start_codon:yes stop_codon:yes gene_type:complete